MARQTDTVITIARVVEIVGFVLSSLVAHDLLIHDRFESFLRTTRWVGPAAFRSCHESGVFKLALERERSTTGCTVLY